VEHETDNWNTQKPWREDRQRYQTGHAQALFVRREVVAEIKLHNGDKIQLCHEILMGKARKIEHKLQRMSDKSEAVRKTS